MAGRKGTRPRVGVALVSEPPFRASDEAWEKIEAAYGREIPPEVRSQIQQTTCRYRAAHAAEQAAMFVYKQIEALKNIRDLARKLRDLLFPPHGDDQNLLAAVTALRGMRADVESDGGDDLGEMIDSRINNPEEEFRDQLERIASNCAGAQVKLSDDMVDPHASGFVEHAAWDKWICDILRILEESNLLKGVGSNSILRTVTPAVRLILELQGLLPDGERRHQHSASGLAQAMKRARRAIRT